MAVVVPIIVPSIIHKQKRILAAFRAAGATDASRAKTLAELGLEEGHVLRILLGHEVLRDAGERRFWLDEAAAQAHEARRHRFAFTIVAAMLVLVVGGGVVLWLTTH